MEQSAEAFAASLGRAQMQVYLDGGKKGRQWKGVADDEVRKAFVSFVEEQDKLRGFLEVAPRFVPRSSEDDSAWGHYGVWKARMERALQKESLSAIAKRARGVGAIYYGCTHRLPKAEILANIVAVEDPESGTPYSRLRRLEAWISEAEKVGMTDGTS